MVGGGRVGWWVGECPGGGGGGTLIFSHIRRLRLFFGFKILNFSFLGFFQKNEYFLGV